MIKISNRLKAIANEVKYTKIADIGTDHAYIPIYLCQLNKIDFCLACDINKGPLEIANCNIKKYKYENIIHTLLCDGIEKIIPNSVDTLIIAGMGGQLIIDILDKNRELLKSIKQLVLQPQLDIYSVRKYIHKIGFRIDNEQMIVDNKKYYNIINAILGNEEYTKDEYYTFGKVLIDNKSKVLKEYIDLQIKKFDIIINSEQIKNNNKAFQKLNNQIKALKEVRKWL